jgi:DNA modification methylase
MQTTTKDRTLEISYVAIESIAAYENNARLHSDDQIDQIIASINEFGFTNPILIDEKNVVIAGHGRLAAAEKMSLAKVPSIKLTGLTDAQRRAYIIADNKIALNAGWDQQLLSFELSELTSMQFDRSLTGFSEREMQRYTTGGDDEKPTGKPSPPTNPKTKYGQIIELGPHRLMCGDCRDEKMMSKLMGGKKISVAITSPPYASQRKYDETSEFVPVPPDDFGKWFDAVQTNIVNHIADDGSFFINIKEHCDDGQRVLYVKELVVRMVRQLGWKFVDEYIWTHGGTPKAPHRRFKNGFEPIFHFTRNEHKFRPDAVMHETTSSVDWGGGHPADDDGMAANENTAHATEVGNSGTVIPGFAYPSNVLKIGKNMETLAHGAMYPVKLPEFFIRAFSDTNDIIFDPFMGSGTTMIAAHKWDRISYGMEISPAYCDVIVERWNKYNNQS